MRIVAWIEEHPYLAGSAVVGGILLWVIVRRASSASSAAAGAPAGVVVSGPSDAIQAAELSARVQVQSAQIAAQSTIAGYNAAANAKAMDDAAANYQAALAAQTSQSSSANQLQYGLAGYDAANFQAALAAQTAQYSTAAQAQYNLATLGYSPSVSPFGLTVPIGGAGPVNVVVGQQTTQDHNVAGAINDGAIINWAVDAGVPPNPYLSIPLTYNAGGTTDPVPSVAVYGPATPDPTLLGYTQPFQIPQSTGLNWNTYYGEVAAQVGAGSSVNPFSVATATAANIAAQNDYLTNPNSCHNRVC